MPTWPTYKKNCPQRECRCPQVLRFDEVGAFFGEARNLLGSTADDIGSLRTAHCAAVAFMHSLPKRLSSLKVF